MIRRSKLTISETDMTRETQEAQVIIELASLVSRKKPLQRYN